MGLTADQLKKLYLDKKEKFKAEFNNCEDLENLPYVLEKEDMRNNYPDGLLFCDKSEIFQYHETFGTTGIPSPNWLTKADFQAYVDEILLSPVNFGESDFYLNRFPYAISTPAHLFHHAVQQRGGAVIPCSSRTFVSPVSRIVKMIFALNPTIIGCLPDEAMQLAFAAKSLGYKPEQSSLRAICTAGEALTTSQARIIRKLWGAEIYNFYGSTEAGNVAWSCASGNLHIAEDFFSCSIYNDELPELIRERGIGVLVLTTKEKHAFPLYKYFSEDLAEVSTGCECGTHFPLLRHHGRLANCLELNGKVYTEYECKEMVFSVLDKLNLYPFWKIERHEKGPVLCLAHYEENESVPGALKDQFPRGFRFRGIKRNFINQQKIYWNTVAEVGKPVYIG